MMKRIEKHFNNVSVINFDPFQNKLSSLKLKALYQLIILG